VDDSIINKKRFYYVIFIILVSVNLYAEDFFVVKQDILENFRSKIFGVYFNSGLEINNLGYSSNIYSYESNRRSDYTADYRFNLNTAIILRDKFILKVEDSPSYSYYRDNSAERGFYNNLNASFFSYIGRFNLNYSFEKNQMNTMPLDEFGRRLKRDETNNFFSVDYGNLNHFYVNIFIRNQKLEYENLLYLNMFDVSILMNRRENTIGLSFNRRIFTSTRFALGIDYFEHKFIYSSIRNSRGINTFFSLSFRNRGILTGEIRAGMRYFNSSNILYRDYLLPFGSGQINLRVFNGLTITTNYRLDISYSFTGKDVYYKMNSLGIGFNYRFNRQFRIEYRSRYGIMNYRYLTQSFKYREDAFQSHRIIFRYFLSTRFQFGLEMQKFNSNSTQLFYNRDSDFIGGFLRFDF